MKYFVLLLFSFGFMSNNEPLYSQESQGILVFQVLNYTTEVKIPINVKGVIDYADIDWSIIDSTLVISCIYSKFLKPEISNHTRYRDEKILSLNPGKYSITCVSHQLMSDSFSKDIDKVLSSTVFFNLDILSFKICQNDTTIIEILPTYMRYTIKGKDIYNPTYSCTVFDHGEKITKIINLRTDNSISWDDYKGTLKL